VASALSGERTAIDIVCDEPEISAVGLLLADRYVRQRLLSTADSTDRRNSLVESFGGCFVA
jgi:hypothetical protein